MEASVTIDQLKIDENLWENTEIASEHNTIFLYFSCLALKSLVKYKMWHCLIKKVKATCCATFLSTNSLKKSVCYICAISAAVAAYLSTFIYFSLWLSTASDRHFRPGWDLWCFEVQRRTGERKLTSGKHYQTYQLKKYQIICLKFMTPGTNTVVSKTTNVKVRGWLYLIVVLFWPNPMKRPKWTAR